MPMINPESINIDELFKTAMRRDWDKVVYVYTNLSRKIIEHHNNMKAPGETALHVAVAYRQTKHVWDIVDGIPQGDLLEILKMKNDQGDTPLHLAAAIGNLDLCWCISSKDKGLIAERNKEGETPLFQAARHGQEKAFFYLRFRYNGPNGNQEIPRDMLIKNKGNGDTILHSIINGEYYGFALRIIHCYPELVDTVNEKKLTPLHVLALQPRSFPSNSSIDLGLYSVIPYICTYVSEHTWDEEQDIRDFEEIEQRSGNDFSQRPHSNNALHRLIFGRGRSNASGSIDDTEKNLRGPNRGSINKKRNHCCGQILSICVGLILILGFITYMFSMFIASVTFVLFLGNWNLASIRNMRRKHLLATRLVKKLLDEGKAPMYPEVEEDSASCTSEGTGNEPTKDLSLGETPLLTAAKLGIYEMVDLILERFPEAIKEMDNMGKNAVLLAAENRHMGVYIVLEGRKVVHRSVFCQVDKDGNSALHLASQYDENRCRGLPEPGMKMISEFQWYQYVKRSMPSNSFAVRNNAGQTAEEILIKSHKELKKEAHKWLTTTCSAYSLIATLIATVAFATSSTIPGEYNDDGRPRLEGEAAFIVFSISSLISFCTSMSATVFFIAILTARHELEDFIVNLPRWLWLALSFLFLSIASILVCFSSGFYFNMGNSNKLHGATYLIFTVMCLPVTLFAIVQFPVYIYIRFIPARNKKLRA